MKKVKLVDRSKGIISGNTKLEKLHIIKNFPVFFGCTDKDEKDDLYADVNWYIDPQTGIVQLTKLIPLDILYQEQHVDSPGQVWKNFYKSFSEYILSRNPINILEIGGGNGRLAEVFCSISKDIKWTIIDPNPICEETDQIKQIKCFVYENFKFNEKIDTIIFSNLLEHIYDPESFVDMLYDLMDKNTKLVFAHPDLLGWLEKKYTNALNFEHTVLLTDFFVDFIFTNRGFSIKDKIKYNDYMFFYEFEKNDSKTLSKNIPNRYKEYKETYTDFMEYHTNMVEDFNKRLKTETRPVYLFGAHIFSQYLLNIGLNSKKIKMILDNGKIKHDKRLYGTSFIVRSPIVLKDEEKAVVILKAGVYNEEIKKDILENINSNIEFWE